MTTAFIPGSAPSLTEIAALFDHALLKPELTVDQVGQGAREVARRNAWSVCVRPGDVALVREIVDATTATEAPDAAARSDPSTTAICTVIGFPHGTTSSAAKVAEAEQALLEGAVELDMVLNIGRLRSGRTHHQAVQEDIAAVVATGHAQGALVKVILETSLLDQQEKIAACELSAAAGADFVKTSTGFAGGGATLPDVRLLRRHTPQPVQIKASGGVRDVETLLAMLAEGVTRIGTSSTTALLAQASEMADAGRLVVPEPPTDLMAPVATEGY